MAFAVASVTANLALILAFLGLTVLAFAQMWLPIVAQAGIQHEALTLFDFCPHGATPAGYQFTPYEGVNHQVCMLTEFFMNTLLHAEGGSDIAADLAGAVLPSLAFMYLEAERPGASILVRFPLVWWFLFQNIGAGVVLPLYYIVLLIGPQSRAYIPARRAESVLFGIVAGYILPTALMVSSTDYRVFAAWQAFPLFVTLARAAYSFIRPASQSSQGVRDGVALTKTIYVLSLVSTAAVHLYVLFTAARTPLTLPSLIDDYKRTFVPLPLPSHLVQPQHLHTTLINFFKWDWIFISLSTVLAGVVAISKTGTNKAKSVLADPVKWVAVPVLGALLGTGAVMSDVWLLREEALAEERTGKKA